MSFHNNSGGWRPPVSSGSAAAGAAVSSYSGGSSRNSPVVSAPDDSVLVLVEEMAPAAGGGAGGAVRPSFSSAVTAAPKPVRPPPAPTQAAAPTTRFGNGHGHDNYADDDEDGFFRSLEHDAAAQLDDIKFAKERAAAAKEEAERKAEAERIVFGVNDGSGANMREVVDASTHAGRMKLLARRYCAALRDTHANAAGAADPQQRRVVECLQVMDDVLREKVRESFRQLPHVAAAKVSPGQEDTLALLKLEEEKFVRSLTQDLSAVGGDGDDVLLAARCKRDPALEARLRALATRY